MDDLNLAEAAAAALKERVETACEMEVLVVGVVSTARIRESWRKSRDDAIVQQSKLEKWSFVRCVAEKQNQINCVNVEM